MDFQDQDSLELAALCNALVDDTITPEGLSRLQQALGASEDVRRFYVRFMSQDAGLCGYAAEMQTDPSDAPFRHTPPGDPTETVTGASSVAPAPWERHARQEKLELRAQEAFERYKKEELHRQEELLYRAYLAQRRRLAVGVGSLAMLVLILVLAWLAPEHRDPAVQEPVVQPVAATVTRLSQAQWEPAMEIALDAELRPGSLHLVQGYAEITFKSQAAVILEAPVQISLVDRNTAYLEHGVLSAHVPEQARGFVVNTPSTRITDLGTEFGLVVNENAVADVHVLTGEVAASFDSDRDDAPRTSRILRQNEAMRFNSQTGTVQSIALERERFALSWDDVLYKPNLSIGIVFERTIPPSIGPDDFSSDDTMYLFLEKTGVTLSEELAVNVSMPGTYNRFEGTCAILPAGTVVDSYLIHYNPVNKLGTHTKTSTTIAFPRSIVGLIVDTEKLHGSDGILGRERTHYPGNDLGRGLEAASAGVTPSSDRITWTDRRQLQVTLGANLYDQMRVLIASPNLGNEP